MVLFVYHILQAGQVLIRIQLAPSIYYINPPLFLGRVHQDGSLGILDHHIAVGPQANTGNHALVIGLAVNDKGD